jgi:hypothetical protein
MNKFTIIRQKLSLIFIIIAFIISGLVFLNCAYNSLFVWYDNDNDVNLTDGIIPVSSMFGYKILSNSYVVNGTCTKYNNDIILTTNINTISFKIFKMIFTLYVMMIILTYFSQFIAREVIEANPFENTFYSEFKDIIILGIFSVFALSIISNNFNNPGDNEYKEYNDIEETFESYLFAQYMKIDPYDKVTLTNIIKNKNKNNFTDVDDYERIKKTYFGSSSKPICLEFLKLCKDLCDINKDTNVDVVKIFHKFLLNCQISDNLENIKKRYNIIKVTDEITEENKAKANDIDKISDEKYNESQANIIALIADENKSALLKYDGNDYIKGKKVDDSDVYYQIKRYIEPEPSWIEKLFKNYIIKNIEYFFTDIGCVIKELNFLKTNFNSIFELLANAGRAINPFGDDDARYYDKNVEEKSGMDIVLLTSLLTKDFLKDCTAGKQLHNVYEGVYLKKMGEYAIVGVGDNKSFTSLMNDAKKSTYRDLFIIKGLVTGIIVFSFANILLKRYYNIYHTEFLKSIDKNIVLYYIYGDRFNAFKYETIRTLLNANDYSLNVAISLIIIALLLKPWGYPKDINLKC